MTKPLHRSPAPQTAKKEEREEGGGRGTSFFSIAARDLVLPHRRLGAKMLSREGRGREGPASGPDRPVVTRCGRVSCIMLARNARWGRGGEKGGGGGGALALRCHANPASSETAPRNLNEDARPTWKGRKGEEKKDASWTSMSLGCAFCGCARWDARPKGESVGETGRGEGGGRREKRFLVRPTPRRSLDRLCP